MVEARIYCSLTTTIFAICLGYSRIIPLASAPSYRKSTTVGNSHPLIVISFDGFRWDYINRTDTPNFRRFIENGVTARYGLGNAFVTKTFPNHFTLVTGLWEESHGIIANYMYDPQLNQTFTPSNTSASEDPAWFNTGAEPIWVTNQLQVENGRSGVIMWVGGGAPIKWVTPNRYMAYDGNVKNETKVDTLIDWFTDENPINLGLVYFNEPDGYGHEFGPDSEEVTRMIGGLDELVGYMLKKLETKGLLNTMNIIITSDHGFTYTPEANMINLDTFIDPSTYMMPAVTPTANIWPHNDVLGEEIYKNLTSAALKNGNFKVYKREEVPERFHYTHNQRIPPILAVASDTYSFCTGICVYTERGDHGYDNQLQDMHPFFLAMGPSFKKNFSVDTFDNVDVYPLMCSLLGVIPAANNGTMKIVVQLLAEDETSTLVTFIAYITAFTFIASIAGIFLIGTCRYHRYLKHSRFPGYKRVPADARKYGSRRTAAVTAEEESEIRTDSASRTKSGYTEAIAPFLTR